MILEIPPQTPFWLGETGNIKRTACGTCESNLCSFKKNWKPWKNLCSTLALWAIQELEILHKWGMIRVFQIMACLWMSFAFYRSTFPPAAALKGRNPWCRALLTNETLPSMWGFLFLNVTVETCLNIFFPPYFIINISLPFVTRREITGNHAGM